MIEKVRDSSPVFFVYPVAGFYIFCRLVGTTVLV